MNDKSTNVLSCLSCAGPGSFVRGGPNLTFFFVFFRGERDSNQTKIVNEYDQEIPQSQTADNPVAPRGRAAQPSRDTRKTN